MNSDPWPGTHSVSGGGGGKECFIYGPLHFWLWWLQYLCSYLNCIFKDFIQYLHAIQYELSLSLFLFFFNLPAFCLVLFNSLHGHVLSLSLSKHAGWIYLQHEMFLLETFSMFSCVLLTVDHQERAVEKRPVLDELNFVTLCFEYK